MAKFSIAEGFTSKYEGYYANNPADNGGETWRGVARKFWPYWKGWAIVDAIKKKYGKETAAINKHGKADASLTKYVSEFYKQNFWDENALDHISDQQLANTVYDFGVNSGTPRAAKTLQQAVNDTGLVTLDVDGQIGPKTIAAINALNPATVHENYNRRREEFYKGLAKGSQAQFLKSWLSRLSSYKSC